MNTKKIFLGGINTDEVDHLMKPEEYLGAMNMRFTTSENSKVGYMSNIEGNVKKEQGLVGAISLPAGVNTTIGAYEDSPNRRVYYFNKNSNGSHGIYCYDSDADLVYTVLLNADVTGGLNFSSDIHSVAMVDDQLFWTDGANQPRRINVLSAMKLYQPALFSGVTAYTSPVSQSVINVIRNQPWNPLTTEKQYDGAYTNNFISTESFQFAYRFVYKDFEVSCFSPWSILQNYNLTTDNYNKIAVTIPLEQKIEQDVIRIEVAVRFAVGGKMFIIKTFKSGFSAHNAGSALTFDFYNDTVGLAVDDASANKQYDVVPVKSSTLEIARNRLFLANNYEGYQSPTTTSLALSTTTGGSAVTVTGTWVKLIYKTTGSSTATLYLVDITGISTNPGYYEPASQPTPPPYPSTVDYTTCTFRGAGLANVLTYLGKTWADIVSFQTGLAYPTITNYSGSIPSIVGQQVFKSDGSYRLGVVFYDEAGRKCGVVTSDSLKISTADRNYTTVAYTTDINWTLSNVAATTEIPDWAYYYQVVMTKNLRASSFIQMRCDDIKYAAKDASGNYTVTTTSYATNLFGLAIKVSSLFSYGMGYTYQAGDILKLYPSGGGAPYSLKVKDTYSDYIITDLYPLGTLSGTITNYLYEIYTPYIQSTNEFYYEKGSVNKVLNPASGTRQYSVLTGSFKGDVVILQRSVGGNAFNAEAMSPNDLYWSNWNTNTGRPSIVIDSGVLNKSVNIRFSNAIVPGSEVNGLCTFDALDETQLPYELSNIQRLMLVSKIEAEGTVMLAVGEEETASIYLGESQVFDNTGSSFLAKSSGVIGNVNVLRGSFGTINPESVVRVYGNVYWYDASWGAVVRYDVNGLFPVSSNKMFGYFKKMGTNIRNSNLKVFAGIDPYNNEVLMSMPKTSDEPLNEKLDDQIISISSFSNDTFFVIDSDGSYIEDGSGNLLIYNPSGDGSYSATVNITAGRLYKMLITNGTATYAGNSITNNEYFFGLEGYSTISINISSGGSYTLYEIVRSLYNPYDGQGGVWVYKADMDRWTSFYSYKPEWFCKVGDRLVSFKNGFSYVHSSGVYNQFYGYTYDSAIAFLHNEAANVTKVYNSLSVEGDTPNRVHVRTEVPYVQSTDVQSGAYSAQTRINGDFIIKEGVSYADIYRDRLSPNVSGDYDVKMLKGDPIRGEVAKFQVIFLQPNTLKKLKFVNIGFTQSWGNTTINNQ